MRLNHIVALLAVVACLSFASFARADSLVAPQRGYINWPEFVRLMQRYPLPKPVLVHSVYRQQRNQDLRSRMR